MVHDLSRLPTNALLSPYKPYSGQMSFEQKQLLRDQARKHRAQISVAVDDYERAAAHFFAAFPEGAGRVVSAYWPKGREFDPVLILEQAAAHGFVGALPFIEGIDKPLTFYHWAPGEALEAGPYDILHPAQRSEERRAIPDIVIVPLLAYDRKGTRLGQGGGYYDRTLAGLRAQKDIIVVGLAYATQAVLFNLPSEAHDQKLDWVITPEGTQQF